MTTSVGSLLTSPRVPIRAVVENAPSSIVVSTKSIVYRTTGCGSISESRSIVATALLPGRAESKSSTLSASAKTGSKIGGKPVSGLSLNCLGDVATHPRHLGLVFRAPSTSAGVLPLVWRPVCARS
jgi:hypothetical protein